MEKSFSTADSLTPLTGGGGGGGGEGPPLEIMFFEKEVKGRLKNMTQV